MVWECVKEKVCVLLHKGHSPFLISYCLTGLESTSACIWITSTCNHAQCFTGDETEQAWSSFSFLFELNQAGLELVVFPDSTSASQVLVRIICLGHNTWFLLVPEEDIWSCFAARMPKPHHFWILMLPGSLAHLTLLLCHQSQYPPMGHLSQNKKTTSDLKEQLCVTISRSPAFLQLYLGIHSEVFPRGRCNYPQTHRKDMTLQYPGWQKINRLLNWGDLCITVNLPPSLTVLEVFVFL